MPFVWNFLKCFPGTSKCVHFASSIGGMASRSTAKDIIEIKGARANNLKNIDVELPKNKLIVVTGVSGSGKSSLIVDTLYAEGQRRYVESLSAYARQFLNRMKKPDVDYIKGLCPAIAIEQRVVSGSARSTVGSLTELYDYLRLLFARLGKTYSPVSGQQVKRHAVSDVVDSLCNLTPGERIYIAFPLGAGHAPKTLARELEMLHQKGFTRVFANGALANIDDLLGASPKKSAAVAHGYVVVDRLILQEPDEDFRKRVADSVQTAFAESQGLCDLIVAEREIVHFSGRFELDGITFPEPSPEFFNYNNPYGACPTCEGYGRIIGIDELKVVPNSGKSVYGGAIACWSGEKGKECLEPLYSMAGRIKFPIHAPYRELTDAQREVLWYGKGAFVGIHAYFKDLEQKLYKIQNRIMLARFRGKTTCATCRGSRLRPETQNVRFSNRRFSDLMFVPADELLAFFEALELSPYEREVGTRLILEITSRLKVLVKIGLGYLSLDRLASTLSGGESQRIHLTRTLGSNLTSSLYILDEPSIGLHPRDTARLVEALHHLRNLGNTVIVIEHEEEIIRKADQILDIGPGAGIHGGQVAFSGPYSEFLERGEDNLTAAYLTGRRTIAIPSRRSPGADRLILSGVHMHNIHNLTVHLPLRCMIGVSGVSGSGKTTLVRHVLLPLLQTSLQGDGAPGQDFGSLDGALRQLNMVEMVGQQVIGRSSRSNPATYVKAYDDIRDIFRNQPLAKLRGYQPRHFSFNVEGGRCEACKGDGEIVVEMQFLADVSLVCEDCNGKRFTNEILEVRFREKSIFDVLELSVEQALEFFSDHREICKKLKPLADVGLHYLKLGQSSSTLSGGEAQRLKLAYYLGLESSSERIFFIFDEPTTGLHFDDIRNLLFALHALVDKGHTVLVIEHNTDVLKTVDWLIDLGPGGGKHGGRLLYEGPPEGIISSSESQTAVFLTPKIS
ncbi:MAG: UvrABC system protein A [Saprospiraceae bacterium]|jgi:excinuclease ABC subunit A|nr:UvrABC system protein A [Saprospiraceae bacterium]